MPKGMCPKCGKPVSKPGYCQECLREYQKKYQREYRNRHDEDVRVCAKCGCQPAQSKHRWCTKCATEYHRQWQAGRSKADLYVQTLARYEAKLKKLQEKIDNLKAIMQPDRQDSVAMAEVKDYLHGEGVSS